MKHVGSLPHSELYTARQNHVERVVILEILHQDIGQDTLNLYLKTARKRVASTLPHVAQVIESGVTDGSWYLTQEKPLGTNLEQLYKKNEQLTPLQVCAIIKTAAQLYTHCAEQQLQAAPLSRTHIFMKQDKTGCKISFLSPIYDTPDQPTHSHQHMQGLADALLPLLPTNTAGQTRIATLIQWLKEGYEGNYLDWPAVESTALMIEEQLIPPAPSLLSATQATHTNLPSRRIILKQQRVLKHRIVQSLCLLLFLALCLAIGICCAPSEPKLLPPRIGDYLLCQQNNQDIYASVHPVSIVQYNRFLSAYAGMTHTQKAAVNKGIPDGIIDHTPAQWEEQLQAADKQTQWQGRTLTEESPVTGVSYWAALAYAHYHQAELPDTDLLLTLRQEIGSSDIQEWTKDLQPANVVYAASHLVLPPDSTTPIAEPNPASHHPHRGFRIMLSSLPTP